MCVSHPQSCSAMLYLHFRCIRHHVQRFSAGLRSGLQKDWDLQVIKKDTRFLHPGNIRPSLIHLSLIHLGLVHPGLVHPGLVHLGLVHPGLIHPGLVHPGLVHRGLVHPGLVHPGLPQLCLVSFSAGTDFTQVAFERLEPICSTTITISFVELNTPTGQLLCHTLTSHTLTHPHTTHNLLRSASHVVNAEYYFESAWWKMGSAIPCTQWANTTLSVRPTSPSQTSGLRLIRWHKSRRKGQLNQEAESQKNKNL